MILSNIALRQLRPDQISLLHKTRQNLTKPEKNLITNYDKIDYKLQLIFSTRYLLLTVPTLVILTN
jgi:hypothetical protein